MIQETAPWLSDAEAREVATHAQAIAHAVEQVILGKSETVRLMIIGLLSGGHLLIEDIPGVGKTTLARAIAKAIGGQFRRIQFTPDLLPADVTGSVIYNQARGAFEFHPGPIFANIVLADEINRATPKTQSALLEAMEERTVSVEGESHPLPKPFLVIATQNNIEMVGTYPLPEAQLDRFFARVSLGYPSPEVEAQILESRQLNSPLEQLQPVLTPEQLVALQRQTRRLYVSPSVRRYVVDVVNATRRHPKGDAGRQPARVDCADAGRAGTRPARRQALHHPRRCATDGGSRAGAPPDAPLRHDQPHPRRDRDSRDSVASARAHRRRRAVREYKTDRADGGDLVPALFRADDEQPPECIGWRACWAR
jgi:MoxR-like ATPase